MAWTRDEMAAIIEHGMADPGQVMFAIVPVETGRAAGFCSLMRIDPTMGSVEVGGIMLGRQLQPVVASRQYDGHRRLPRCRSMALR